MRARQHGIASIIASLCMLLTVTGCPMGDPEGPGASGFLALGAGIDASTFQSLEVRGFPNAGPFDPKALLPSSLLFWRTGATVRDVTFPFHYEVGEGIGTTMTRDWRLVAWLSHRASDVVAIEKGDVYCTVVFSIRSCGVQYGDYCGVTQGVGCTLETVAP
jgi:hypothetical protein